MKISFNKSTEDYIGSYLTEYNSIRINGRRSVVEVLNERQNIPNGEIINIAFEETCIYKYLINKDDVKIKDCDEFRSDLYNGYLKSINKQDLDKITEIEKQYLETDKYTNDLALLVTYAELRCFRHRKKYLENIEALFSRKQRRDIINFYTLVANRGLDIFNIEFNYNELVKDKQGFRDIPESRKLVINSPVIMKMLLYEFAKKYFNVFEKLDIEATETFSETINGIEFIKELDYPLGDMIGDLNIDITKDETLAKTKKDFDSKRVAKLIELYFNFIKHYNILDVDQKFKIYGLIGNLLAIAGYESYADYKNRELRDNYKNINNYYYKKLTKLYKP